MLKSLELTGFKSFSKRTLLEFSTPVTAIVGPNGSGKSNIVEAIRFVLGEQSMKSLRGKAGTDLIFKGSKNLPALSRAKVLITFDNSSKIFTLSGSSESKINLDFDEITIGREVFSDGTTTYLLNGSEVRLKDIIELLASVNIGSSGHHIISQGEADRILSSNARERRAMIEDALGLKIYQYKIRESERKLERTAENMKEVGALRREIAPHLVFLKKQVEKIERAEALRTELRVLYGDYFGREAHSIKDERKKSGAEKRDIESALATATARLATYADATANRGQQSPEEKNLADTEQSLIALRNTKEELKHNVGRIEGMLEALSAPKAENKQSTAALSIAREEFVSFVQHVEADLDAALAVHDLADVFPILKRIKSIVAHFGQERILHTASTPSNGNEDKIAELADTKAKLDLEFDAIAKEENILANKISTIKRTISEKDAEHREAERAFYERSQEKKDLESRLSMLALREESLVSRETNFENEQNEARALLGAGVLQYHESASGADAMPLDEMRKKIERIKIKLEDAGGTAGEDVIKEYKETADRDQFLSRELEDLSTSIVSLKTLIADLKAKLDAQFKDGISKINRAFGEFFSTMFGGGTAELKVSVEHVRPKGDEDMDGDDEGLKLEKGIEISVSLPHKKIRELTMLSGGERSLTSIALLFAMSSVNPPPFLVLDETDAALDEANSRKYGNMIESLSKYSQLIVVTHNRETMSRASVLYGITIGADGGSKLLSIKFDEAVKIAK